MAQTTIKNRQIAGGLDGWIPAGETWNYASADDPTFTFTVAADVTTKYSAGMKIKLTQGTVKYFIITAVSTYSGGNTTITVYGGTDYDLANSAISANAYSMMKSPQGFPMSPTKWSVVAASSTDNKQTNPTAGTWYNPGSHALTVPIGAWNLSYQGNFEMKTSTAVTLMYGNTTLSTTNDGETDDRFNNYFVVAGASANYQHTVPFHKENYVELTSKTIYYLNQSSGASLGATGYISTVGFSSGDTIIMANCAYL